MSSSWSDHLPDDVLLLIAKKVTHGSDFMSFSHVCSSWRSIAKQERKRFRPEFPGFLTEQGSNAEESIRFQSLSKLKRRPELFLPRNSAVFGSHQGWIVMEEETKWCNNKLVLINPVTQVRFKLPFHFYSRIVFSANPMDYCNCYYVIVNSWCGLKCCKSGDVGWTDVETSGDEHSSLGFMDAIYYRGKLYAVRITGELFVCDDISASPPMMTKLLNNPRDSPALDLHSLTYESRARFFLVEAGQELLLVYCRGKYLSSSKSSSKEALEVYRLNHLGGVRWDRVRNLGEHALFLGESQSFSLSESDVRGIKGNQILYMEESKNLKRRREESSWESEGEKDSEDSEKEICVFSLEKSRAGRLATIKSPWEKTLGFWFMPQFFC